MMERECSKKEFSEFIKKRGNLVAKMMLAETNSEKDQILNNINKMSEEYLSRCSNDLKNKKDNATKTHSGTDSRFSN